MTVKFTRTRTISGGGQGPTVGELKQLIDGLDDGKQVRMDKWAGDSREPSTWTLTVNELS